MDVATIRRVCTGLLGPFALLIAACGSGGGDAAGTGGSTATRTVAAAVTGLVGSGLVLQDNAMDDLPVDATGTVVFKTPLAAGAAYSVSVKAQPTAPDQTCTVLNGSGSVGSTNVADVAVSCALTLVPEVTAVGTPTGSAVVASIGPAGGSVASADGRITLTVPAGAVASATDFSVQPMTNLAPGGTGSAYRLRPEGATFTQPIAITFHYDDNDLAGSFPEALRAVYQDAQGIWNQLLPGTLDSAGKTMTVTSSHFSVFTIVREMVLIPVTGAVTTGDKLKFTLQYCLKPVNSKQMAACHQVNGEDPPPEDDDLAVPSPTWKVSEWAVNGAANGDGTVGTIAGTGQAATYTAPATVPSPATVTVSAKLPIKRGSALLLANVTVTSAQTYQLLQFVSIDGSISIGDTVLTYNSGGDVSETEVTTSSELTFSSGTPSTGVLADGYLVALGDNTYGMTFAAPALITQGAVDGTDTTAVYVNRIHYDAKPAAAGTVGFRGMWTWPPDQAQQTGSLPLEYVPETVHSRQIGGPLKDVPYVIRFENPGVPAGQFTITFAGELSDTINDTSQHEDMHRSITLTLKGRVLP